MVKKGLLATLISPLIKLGLRFLLKGIEKWANEKGVDVNKPLDPINIKIERGMIN